MTSTLKRTWAKVNDIFENVHYIMLLLLDRKFDEQKRLLPIAPRQRPLSLVGQFSWTTES